MEYAHNVKGRPTPTTCAAVRNMPALRKAGRRRDGVLHLEHERRREDSEYESEKERHE